MCAHPRIVPCSIASLANLITSVQLSYARQHMQHSNIVTPPISVTIHILTTVTLSLHHLQCPQLITMRSTAHRQDHTTIKWVSYVQPPAAYRPLSLSSLIALITNSQTVGLLVQRNIATFFRKSTTLLHFIVRIKMMTILTLHLKGQCRSLQ